ncbi:MAG: hypothetical protein WAR83_13285, partial [Flavobacteriales bacterium]
MESIKNTSSHSTNRPGSKRKLKIILIVVLTLVAIRIALPYALLHFANKRLANMPNYDGHIDDLDLAIIRGAYTLDGFYLDNVDSISQERTPFLAAREIDLSIEWKSLFNGAIVGELEIEEPRM